MDRYIGIDAHGQSCTLGVVGPSGKRLRSVVVETNGQALVEAVRSVAGRRHICLEEGTQSAWLYELLSPFAEEVVVTVPPESRGSKDDVRDAWKRAEELRVGGIQTRVYKAPAYLAGLRNSVRAYVFAVRDVVRAKNRLKSVFLSRGVSMDAGVYDPDRRDKWLKRLPTAHRQLAERLARQVDELEPLRDEAEEWLLKESKRSPHHPEAEHGTRNGRDPECDCGFGGCGSASVPNESAVLELLWARGGDALVCELDQGSAREARPHREHVHAWPHSEAQCVAQGCVQGCGHHGDHTIARAFFAPELPAHVDGWDQTQPGEADTDSSDRSDRALHVEARGGIRPAEAEEGCDRSGIGAPSTVARTTWCALGVARRKRFEGERPRISWSPGRDGEAPFADYAPSEYRLKRWPEEALSGAWYPPVSRERSRTL